MYLSGTCLNECIMSGTCLGTLVVTYAAEETPTPPRATKLCEANMSCIIQGVSAIVEWGDFGSHALKLQRRLVATPIAISC